MCITIELSQHFRCRRHEMTKCNGEDETGVEELTVRPINVVSGRVGQSKRGDLAGVGSATRQVEHNGLPDQSYL